MAGSLNIPAPGIARGNRPFSLLGLNARLPRPLSFVMAGGGAHGSVQWGALQAMAETDVRPDLLVGTSVGAMTAAVYAEDPVSAATRLGYIWNQLDVSHLVGDSWVALLTAATKRQRSLADSSAAREAIAQAVTARDFTQLRLPMAAVATDLATGEAVALDSGPLLDALMASSAIPGLMPPVTIADRMLVDGLASANLPASIAVDRGAKAVIVFDTGARADAAPARSPVKLVSRINAILNANQRRAQLAYAASRVPVILLPTPGDLSGALDFRSATSHAAETYQIVRQFLTDLSAQQDHHRLRPGLYARDDDPLATDLDLASRHVPIFRGGAE